jgi:hypothetical protein
VGLLLCTLVRAYEFQCSFLLLPSSAIIKLGSS